MRAEQDHSGGPVSAVLQEMMPSQAPVEAMTVKLVPWEDMDSTSGNSRPARRVRRGPTTGFVPLPPSQYFRQSGTTERLPARRLAGPSLFVPSTLYIHRPT